MNTKLCLGHHRLNVYIALSYWLEKIIQWNESNNNTIGIGPNRIRLFSQWMFGYLQLWNSRSPREKSLLWINIKKKNRIHQESKRSFSFAFFLLSGKKQIKHRIKLGVKIKRILKSSMELVVRLLREVIHFFAK